MQCEASVPVVRDRIAQEVDRRLLDPIFEPQFHSASFGFRKFRNCHQALQAILDLIKKGYRWVVDADIKGFFDNIDHELIMHLVRCEVADGKVLDRLQSYLGSGVLEDGLPRPTVKGTPQGGVISPLLANIVLNHLDWRLQSEGFQFVRYADDFVVLCRTKDEAEKALAFIHHVIEQELALQLHPDKTQVVHYLQGFDFLGFHIAHHSCRMRHKAVEKFKDKVRDITTRSHNLDPDVIGKLNRVIRGTVNYFGPPFATGQDLFEKLDRWIRKRIRCMKFKRIRRMDNARLLNKYIAKRGLLSCYELFTAAQLRSNRSLS